MSVAHRESRVRESVAVHDGSMLIAPPRAVAKSARGLVRCPSVGVYSKRCFMLLASLAGRTAIDTAVVATGDVGSSAVEPFALEGTHFKWVKALPQEGHASACLRNGLDPTGALVFLPDEASGMVVLFFPRTRQSQQDRVEYSMILIVQHALLVFTTVVSIVISSLFSKPFFCWSSKALLTL